MQSLTSRATCSTSSSRRRRHVTASARQRAHGSGPSSVSGPRPPEGALGNLVPREGLRRAGRRASRGGGGGSARFEQEPLPGRPKEGQPCPRPPDRPISGLGRPDPLLPQRARFVRGVVRCRRGSGGCCSQRRTSRCCTASSSAEAALRGERLRCPKRPRGLPPLGDERPVATRLRGACVAAVHPFAGSGDRADQPESAGADDVPGQSRAHYYGVGPVPRKAPRVLWRYPRTGRMCSLSTDETGRHTWCGVGWTGQPNVIPKRDGHIELRFGAYDRGYHFLDAATGMPLRPTLMTGDLAKGSATSDPDGYPFTTPARATTSCASSRSTGPGRRCLWQVNADTSVPKVVWNNDWDGAPLVVGDYLIEGGENSWLYVIRLNRGYDREGKVRVRPKIVRACRAGTSGYSPRRPTARSRSRTRSRSTAGSPTSRTRRGSCRAGTSRHPAAAARQRSTCLPLLDGRRHGRVGRRRQPGSSTSRASSSSSTRARSGSASW